jgi:histone H3/H4
MEIETIDEPGELTSSERGVLDGMEMIIERGKRAFLEVGTALMTIRDSRLYRAEYKTFEDYCQTRWGFGLSQTYRLMDAAKIALDLSPIGEILNEGTAREFVSVPKEDRPAVAEAAKAIAVEHGRETINSRDVKEAKERYTFTRTEEVRTEPEKPRLTNDQMSRLNLARRGQSQVANIKTDSALIEEAEREGIYCRIDRNSIWGNPYVLDEDGDRFTVIENYMDYLSKKPSLHKKAEMLRGKILGCWCYPEPCHGQHLIQEFRL